MYWMSIIEIESALVQHIWQQMTVLSYHCYALYVCDLRKQKWIYHDKTSYCNKAFSFIYNIWTKNIFLSQHEDSWHLTSQKWSSFLSRYPSTDVWTLALNISCISITSATFSKLSLICYKLENFSKLPFKGTSFHWSVVFRKIIGYILVEYFLKHVMKKIPRHENLILPFFIHFRKPYRWNIFL